MYKKELLVKSGGKPSTAMGSPTAPRRSASPTAATKPPHAKKQKIKALSTAASSRFPFAKKGEPSVRPSPGHPAKPSQSAIAEPTAEPTAAREAVEQAVLQPTEEGVEPPSVELQTDAQIAKKFEPSRPMPTAPVPEGPTSTKARASGKQPLLASASKVDADEEYSKDEHLLNEFVKLHPMLSLQATTSTTLQLISGMMEKAHVKIPELEIVPKSHDDQFLCPANEAVGERPCVCGEKCLANFIARVRFGPETERGFVCKEFLLPSQYRDFLAGKGLPKVRQKCLICSRYWQSYVYILVRARPTSPHTSPPTHTAMVFS